MKGVVGNDVFTHLGRGVISTALEVFYYRPSGTEPAITFLQQRAPVLQGRNQAFAEAICDFIQKSAFSSVLLLLSSDATRRVDSQIVGPQLRYFTTALSSNESEEKASHSSSHPLFLSSSLSLSLIPLETDTLPIVLKSGTVSSHLFSKMSDRSSSLPPLSVLLHFVHEGYNVPEALAIATSVASSLKLPVPKIPESQEKSEEGQDYSSSLPRLAWVLPPSMLHIVRSPNPDPRVFG